MVTGFFPSLLGVWELIGQLTRTRMMVTKHVTSFNLFLFFWIYDSQLHHFIVHAKKKDPTLRLGYEANLGYTWKGPHHFLALQL